MAGEAIRKLRESFQQEAAKHGPLAFYDAEVLDVDSTEYTCTIVIDEVPIYEVRLRAIISTNSSIDVLPKVGASIVVGKMGDDDYIMIACDELDEYKITIGTMVIKVDPDGITIGNGTETLGKLLTDLVTATLSIAAPKDAATLTALQSTRIKSILK